MFKKNHFLIIAILFCITAFGQKKEMEDKIDPFFRTIVEQQKLKDSVSKNCSSISKTGMVSKNASQKKYECIVYTKNGKALKDSGIIVNSILPTFVTALVTINQILQMASWPDVTYIEAAKNYKLHKANNNLPD